MYEDRISRWHRPYLLLPLSVVASLMLWVIPQFPAAGAGDDSNFRGPVGKHGWGPYHWTKPKSDPRKIKFLNATQGSWADQLPKSISDWDKSKKFKFSRKSVSKGGADREKCKLPKKYGQIHVCNFHYNWGEAARGTIKPDAYGIIKKGSIKLSDAVPTGDRRSVICHEIGHTLGLDHRVEKSSCMYNGVDKYPLNPDNHDFERLNSQTNTGRAQARWVSGARLRGGGTSINCVHFSRTARGGTKMFFRLILLPPSLHFHKLV